MRYGMLLKTHANIRYRMSLEKLAIAELECLLRAWGIESDPFLLPIAGETFIAFDAEAVSDAAWACLSRHSGICLAAQIEGGDTLRPLRRDIPCYLPEDLPHVLKYKGKTNVDFTMMMLNCARAVSAFARSDGPLTAADPICGKATTPFCAMLMGDNAVGVDLDQKALTEADGYLERSFQLHHIKYNREISSRTLPKGKSARTVTYTYADTAEHRKQGDTRSLCLIEGDTLALRGLLKPGSCQLLVGDLPYGVQHAPHEARGLSSLKALAWDAMPGYAAVLARGGAMALSFNINTLKRAELSEAIRAAGLSVLEGKPFDSFSHWVEQAVERDVVFAVKES